MPKRTSKTGSELFIVDNSDELWKVVKYLRDWWPSKRPTDAGWAYVGILGEEFVEAVTVVIANVDGELLIRDIEWGRP